MSDRTPLNPFRFGNTRDASSERAQPALGITLFVYRTLKRGFWNHDRFCRNAVQIQPATTFGRLFALPAGYPALVIPEEFILTRGTHDPLADAAVQADVAGKLSNRPDPPRPTGDWDLIHGELITFADPARELPLHRPPGKLFRG